MLTRMSLSFCMLLLVLAVNAGCGDDWFDGRETGGFGELLLCVGERCTGEDCEDIPHEKFAVQIYDTDGLLGYHTGEDPAVNPDCDGYAGRFHLRGLPTGRLLVVIATAHAVVGGAAFKQLYLAPGAPITPHHLRLQPTCTFAGRVRAPNCSAGSTEGLGGVTVTLDSYLRASVTDDEGNFQFNHVPCRDGAYQLTGLPSRALFTATCSCDGEAVLVPEPGEVGCVEISEPDPDPCSQCEGCEGCCAQCPECPECPQCPGCDSCCEECPECPECPGCDSCCAQCPECPECPERQIIVEWDSPCEPADSVSETRPTKHNENNGDSLLRVVGARNAKGIRHQGTHTCSTNSVPYAEDWLLSNGDEKYWLINLNTKGFGAILVSSRQWSSDTGPQSFTFQFSLDGEEWEEGSVFDVTARKEDWLLPREYSDQEQVLLRWLADGDSVTGLGGTNYIDNISITGEPI